MGIPRQSPCVCVGGGVCEGYTSCRMQGSVQIHPGCHSGGVEGGVGRTQLYPILSAHFHCSCHYHPLSNSRFFAFHTCPLVLTLYPSLTIPEIQLGSLRWRCKLPHQARAQLCCQGFFGFETLTDRAYLWSPVYLFYCTCNM